MPASLTGDRAVWRAGLSRSGEAASEGGRQARDEVQRHHMVLVQVP
jgi:hypothetical protein